MNGLLNGVLLALVPLMGARDFRTRERATARAGLVLAVAGDVRPLLGAARRTRDPEVRARCLRLAGDYTAVEVRPGVTMDLLVPPRDRALWERANRSEPPDAVVHYVRWLFEAGHSRREVEADLERARRRSHGWEDPP